MYKIEFYEDNRGKSEVLDYIQELRKNNSKESRQKFRKINMYIDLLSECGFRLNEPYIKNLDEEIWELRPMRERILFAGWYNNKFILLSHFMKKTQKTPRREIEKAKRLFEDYKRRSEENGEI